MPCVCYNCFIVKKNDNFIRKERRMTQGEFDSIGWTGQMKCNYKGGIYGIGSVCFEERLVGLSDYCTCAYVGDLQWVRCENIELASDNNGVSSDDYANQQLNDRTAQD
jgi:hypothetical protein